MRYPNLREEKKLWRKGYKRVAGLDEAGRGPLAGPVVAAVVMIKMSKSNLKSKILNLKSNFKGIKDSKKLTPKKREEFYKLIVKSPFWEWGVGRVSEKVIDKINILEATKLAMIKAVKNLEKKLQKQLQTNKKFISYIFYGRRNRTIIDFLILDGNFKIGLDIPQKSIVKGDEKVFSCAAASILAKVYRDRIMERYDKKYPRYGFSKHKGYPTKYHLKMLKKYGPCEIHRKTFKPVKEMQKSKTELPVKEAKVKKRTKFSSPVKMQNDKSKFKIFNLICWQTDLVFFTINRIIFITIIPFKVIRLGGKTKPTAFPRRI